MKPALEVSGLTKVYQDGDAQVTAVAGIDLKVPEGQLLCVRGPSGSGKSTLLHLVAGLTPPTEGHIRVGDVRVDGLNRRQAALFRRRHVGLVFQFFNLIQHLTVEENVALPRLWDGYRVRHLRPRIGELLGELGIGERQYQRASNLSGGELQRVAIARALITEPDILLADEPTGNLDVRASTEIYMAFRSLCREHGVTMMMVTHDPDATAYADRWIELQDGRIVEDTARPSAELAP